MARAKILASSFLLFSAVLLAQAPPDRVTAPVNTNNRISLPNSIPTAAISATSSSLADPGLALDHIILLLQPSAQQQTALQTLITQQQDPHSASYHKFLTPAQFADSFGVSQNDVNKVAAWLVANGFHIDELTSNRLAIVFSGNATQVNTAFHTQMKQYVVHGEKHYANAAQPEIPAALAPVVKGFVKLNDFHAKSSIAKAKLRPRGAGALYTDGAGGHELAPADYAVIYNLNPLFNAGINGTNQTIAVVGRSNVLPTDITTFRSTYALPALSLNTIFATGTDPGIVTNGDDIEATLDLEWAGAVAPSAAIDFIIAASTASTDGLDLAAQYAVTHNVAPILSVSFGACEATANNAFYDTLWQQAASQGMSVLVAAGDSGAAGCDDPTAATGTIQSVNAICTTPYTTCVGGTMFSDTADPSLYWLGGNNQSLASAIGYIPEVAWNESALTPGGSGLAATGGGASGIYPKPFWQAGSGVPADGHRDVPDISLTAAQHDGYLLTYQGSTYTVSGTSAAAPSFAGIMALVEQKNGGAQGNVAPALYPLATKAATSGINIFHDITSGNNTVPGVTGYTAASGYDLATGLGSVDANLLATHWNLASNAFSFNAASNSINAAPGQNGTVVLSTTASGSFNSAVTFSTSALPPGVIASFAPSTVTGTGSTTLSLIVASWAASGTYPVTVTATGGGVTRTVTVSVVVVVSTNCSFTAAPTSLTLLLTQSASLSLTCTNIQGSFPTGLALTVTGMPAGVTASFVPAATLTAGTGATTLIVNAAATAVPGTYTLVATATLPNASPAFVKTLNIPLTVNLPATFKVTTSTSSLTLAQAGSAGVTLTSLHLGSFNSSIAFTLSSLPSGVTATISPSPTIVAAPGDGTVSITLNATPSATIGKFTLLVTAIGAKLSLQIPIALQVTAAPAFSFSSAGVVMTLRQSNTASITLTTSTPTNNFNLPVTFAVTGLPTGVTASFTPATIAAPGIGTSTMTLTAGATAATGISTISVTATGGSIVRYANLRLTLTPAPTFSLAASLPAYTIVAGGSLTETVTSTGLYGYTSNIQLSAGTQPAGMSVAFAATTINGAYGTTTMTIQTASVLAAGAYPIVVTGTDANGMTHSTTVTLTVGTVTTSINPATISLTPGGSATATITIVVISYTGNVTLSLPTLPTGVNYALTSTTLTSSGTSTLTLSASPTITPGMYTVSLRTSAGGVISNTPFTLVIS